MISISPVVLPWLIPACYFSGTISPGIHFKRDVVTSDDTGSECEGSRVAPIVSYLYTSAGIQAFRSAIDDIVGASFLQSSTN